MNGTRRGRGDAPCPVTDRGELVGARRTADMVTGAAPATAARPSDRSPGRIR
jgi:hypothetical protein